MPQWMPRGGVWVVVLALLYDIMPFDFVWDAVPVFGLADDLGVTGLAALTLLTWYRRHKREQAQLLQSDAPVE